eukprot:gene14311-20293_t
MERRPRHRQRIAAIATPLLQLVVGSEKELQLILKVMADHSAASVKNYHLELLTLLAQDAAAARGGAQVADGSMQLVLDVLQSIADDKMPMANAAETRTDLNKDQFIGLVSKLKVSSDKDPTFAKVSSDKGPTFAKVSSDKGPTFAKVTLVYGHPGPGSRKLPFSPHLAIVVGMSVVMEDLALVVPDSPGVSAGHCVCLSKQAQLEARGCVFSSPKAPCIGAGGVGGAHCRLIDCCFGPDKERGASAGVVVQDGSNLVAERCLFLRCREPAVEVRAGSRAPIKGCKFIKCQKQAVMLYNGGKELVMEDCLIERCGNNTVHQVLMVACGTAQLHKCSFVSNRIDAVVVQRDNQHSAPVLDIREWILKGNMAGVNFVCGKGPSGSGGSGILVNNQITGNASFGLCIQGVAPNLQVQLIGNVFQGNGSNIAQGKVDIVMFQNVKDQVVVKNNRGTILILPFSGLDTLDLVRWFGRH